MTEIDLLVEGGHVLPMDDDLAVIEDGAVAVDGGAVLAVGPREELLSRFRPRRRLGGPRRIVLPGFVNAHTHVPMVLFRGMADDLPLKTWLEEHIWPAEGRWLGDAFCHDASLLAVLEMLRAGVTLYNDMYFFGDAIARATKTVGMRGVVGAGILDFPSAAAKDIDGYLANAEALIGNWRGDELITPCVAPHAPYTCCPEHMTRARELAEKYDVPLHTHLSETAREVEEIRSRYGKTPIELLDGIGFLSERVLAAHCVRPTEHEIEILAERGVGVAHCIESNLKLASGVAPVPRMLEAGVRVALGTDGAASNNDLSVLAEAQTAAKVHKALSEDPTVMAARTVITMATRTGAEVLGMGDRLGRLRPGFAADLVVIDADRPHLTPLYDVYSHLAYCATAADVESVVVAGRTVLEGGRLQTADENEILEKARRWHGRILSGRGG